MKCKKSFYQKGHLNVHIPTIHEDNKDYKCDSCGKSFSEAGHLKKHIHTVHEGQKDHSCESCGKSFSQAIYLKHIHTVHEGHKDHKCEFSQVGNLKKHIHIVMGADRGLNQPVPLRGLRAYFLGIIIWRQIFIA